MCGKEQLSPSLDQLQKSLQQLTDATLSPINGEMDNITTPLPLLDG